MPVLSLLLAAVLVVMTPSSAAALQPPALAEQLLAAERELAKTLASRSQVDMERLLAEEFVLRGSPDVSRETWIREAVARCWGDRFDIDDFAARQDGEVAIATFVLTFYVNPDTCAPGVLRSLITDVWTRREGSWRLAVRHSSAPGGDGVAGQFGLQPEVPPRWLVQSELSLVTTSGNASTRTLGAGGEVTHQTGNATTRASFTHVSNVVDGDTRARLTTLQGRHGVQIRSGLETFGRAGYTRDVFAGIRNRVTLDAGVAFTAADRPRHRLTLEAGAGFTSEARVASDTLQFGVATGTVRYLWRVAPGSQLQEELATTADLSDAGNWRAANALSLTIALTRVVSFKIATGVEYRHEPVPGFGRTDTRTAAALVISFRTP